MASDGLVRVIPSSISHTGTSATLNADGSVDFSSITALILNGIFSATYRNYLMVMGNLTSGNGLITFQYRASGTNATGTDYQRQQVIANGGSASGFRDSSETLNRIMSIDNAQRSGALTYFYSPFLSERTLQRSVGGRDLSNGTVDYYCSVHNLTNSYDGIAMTLPASTSGNLAVYGFEV